MIMAKKKSINENYWDMMNMKQIREEYAAYLKEEERHPGPDSAQLFAIKKIAGGHDYHGLNERDLILLLAGKLPYMYD
jgi:hypothetical protein